MGRPTPFPQPELRHWKSGENEAELLVQRNVAGKSKEKSCTYGTPLPVSPINEVRRVIDYARTEIPPQKLFVGIPNYGYDWPLPYVRGETRAQSLGNVQAVERALARGVAIEYD